MAQRPQATQLRVLDRRLLVPGRFLPGDILDRAGRVLIPGGQRLTQEHLDMLARRGALGLYAGSDWCGACANESEHVAKSVEEASRALKKRRQGQSGRNVRRHTRHAWRAPLAITLELYSEKMLYRRSIQVITMDISVGGFCFTCGQFVYPGSLVYVRFDTLPTKPILKGVVRHCEHVSGRQHKVGVEFLGSGSDFIG